MQERICLSVTREESHESSSWFSRCYGGKFLFISQVQDIKNLGNNYKWNISFISPSHTTSHLLHPKNRDIIYNSFTVQSLLFMSKGPLLCPSFLKSNLFYFVFYIYGKLPWNWNFNNVILDVNLLISMNLCVYFIETYRQNLNFSLGFCQKTFLGWF